MLSDCIWGILLAIYFLPICAFTFRDHLLQTSDGIAFYNHPEKILSINWYV
jgi:hypothetical protein